MMDKYGWGATQFREVAGVDYVLDRIQYLKTINQPRMATAQRIRTIMNGGQAAVDELLDKTGVARDLPVVNMLDSGLTRFAQKLRHPPDVKVDSRADKDSKAEYLRAEKRQQTCLAEQAGDLIRQLLEAVYELRELVGPPTHFGFTSFTRCDRGQQLISLR